MFYLYAVIASAPARLGRGLAGEPLRAVALEKGARVSAVVGETLPPAVTPAALRAHDAVVRRLLPRSDALLPVRFGSTAADIDDLRAQMRGRIGDLALALGLVRGAVQMTVRVFGRAEAPSRPPLPRTVDAGTRYLLEKAAEWRAAESLPEIEPLRVRLAGLVRAERIERHTQTGLVGTAHHLVERAALPPYRARLRGALPSLRPLRLHVSGPWPPYAFAPAVVP
jgi:hypothetical protein